MKQCCGPISELCLETTPTAHSGFVLGTAQLGMNYGRVNRAGKPTQQIAIQMLRYAVAYGVTAIDTARSYGDAECVIGDALTGSWGSRTHVITKLDLSNVDENAPESELVRRVDASIAASWCITQPKIGHRAA